MTLEQVSVENSKYHRQFNPPRSNDEPIAPSDDRQGASSSCPHSFGLNGAIRPGGQSSEQRPKNPLIEKALRQLVKKGLFGRPHVKRYLYDLHRRRCRPNTLRTNFTAIFLFLSYRNDLGKTYLETTTREDLSGFIEHEQDRGLKPTSVSTWARALYAFLGYLVEREIIHPDVLKKKMRIKVPDSLPRAMDPDDVRQLLAVVKKPRDWAMILVLLRTGMRIGELLDTKVRDVNLREKRIEIFEARKNRVGRVVYLSDDARAALKIWFKKREPQKEYLFYGQGHSALTYAGARAIFIKYLAKAGLSHKGYSLHCLRHTFASELLNAGMRLECLQQLLGHSSIEMTRRYARLTDNTRKEEYFRAMAIIEKGAINGYYRLDPAVPKVPEKKELFGAYH
jgi:site-specific recombinase XerD